MADEQPRGRGGRRGGRVRGQPCRGGDGGVGEDESQPHHLSLSNGEEEINSWGDNFHRRDHGFRPRQCSHALGIKVDILDFEGLGHFAADCPNRQIVTILEEDFRPVFDECGDKVEENVFDQEEITYVDSKEALVVRRTLSTVVTNEDESWLRHDNFHTMCTCKGKVCNVIIDGGSCENVISATMVSKLSLMTEEHPHPYKLSWFKKGNETMHDGYKNTYSFKKDGETIILGPFDIRKESKNQWLSQAKSLAEAQDATNVYALVVVESNECRFDVPHEVKAIVDDFADVVPDELPPGLPPMRDIQHCIDFVPEAVIPRKAAYKMY
uniref:Reverse transcriptase domain-containing protein n=1 Tax=Tanacetum cinerariifolium TaxID=118510 RepID=A0A699JU72_TANCI|nr:hypothetical protein [Tanacetum cinerariifolium]